MSPATLREWVMELLSPTTVEACPTCGHERRVAGQPLISRETARKILDLLEMAREPLDLSEVPNPDPGAGDAP